MADNMSHGTHHNRHSGGTGQKLANGLVIVAGVASLVATLISIVSIWLQTKNYRKPLLQRYVVRILLMVPIYSISSWVSLVSLTAASFVDPIRDVYEAFTIYTFLQLLINFIGGERALIIMMHGREPVHHLWPMNHFLSKVDISDPHSFLAIKRGILQYAWLKPVLGLASVIMKATGVYQEGYIGLTSGYLWSGIAYNISVTVSLYSLGMFWVCMSKDLQPFRPMPKFLNIKLIIFASYWQGFGLSILVWLGVIPDDVKGYTPDNIAAAIQDALICLEMPAFAIGHWYAFSWHDYADSTISAARLPVKYALRDSFGIRDLIEDTKETFSGKKYEYRLFDSGDNIIAHEESSSRVARMMEGMRYERGGKGKYWIPKPGEANARTPLLAGNGGPSTGRTSSNAGLPEEATSYIGNPNDGTVNSDGLDVDEEELYAKARKLEYGDWNYPVITAHTAKKRGWVTEEPDLLTTSSNRHLIQPTRSHEVKRKKNVKKTVQKVQSQTQRSESEGSKSKGKGADNTGEEGRAPLLKGMLRHHSSESSSAKSDRSQLVDLVVEDTEAEDIERVRARKEGSAGWNAVEPKRFVRTYGNEGEEVREGFEPEDGSPVIDPKDGDEENSNPNDRFTIGDDDSESPGAHESREWQENREEVTPILSPKYGLPGEDLENVWSGESPSGPAKENP
ncbi:hypothetical protein V496_05632 [Pseudogymnoascus sp. VKM F-4515 (FW-2607)]|nr:hypothetical protein V496_05632 [Pseudogymnoascus sp. VKM F-4515 (FW-2607)]KFY86513.1 hypothetical protein V498_07483 [Pseudogymnoascus sp. VKM F-4517 (FW-2822)]